MNAEQTTVHPSSTGRRACVTCNDRRATDPHFYELLDLASDGNEEAVQDLWLQYEYDFVRGGRPV